jgi:hypothetical protein
VSETSRKGKHGRFFGVDRRTWGQLCDSATINEASAYLVLAQGTGGDSRFTSWSATALKTYAGISWDRANAAIDGLAEKQFLKRAESSTKGKPRYELLSASELAAAIFTKKQDALAPVERLLLTEVREGRGKLKYGRRGNSDTFDRLAALGLVRRQGDTYFAIDAPDARVDPDLIWLPNTLVTGTERGEDSPVRRLRSAGDIWTLRLLIDLYHAQNLRDDGGISPTLLWQEFTRMEVGEQGIFTMWAFKPEQIWVSWRGCIKAHHARPKVADNHPIHESVRNLKNQGLMTFVPHLWDNKCGGESAQAEIIHAYGVGGSGEERGRGAPRARRDRRRGRPNHRQMLIRKEIEEPPERLVSYPQNDAGSAFMGRQPPIPRRALRVIGSNSPCRIAAQPSPNPAPLGARRSILRTPAPRAVSMRTAAWYR